MDSPLLQLTSVTKSFGAVRALKGVSFDLQAGEVPQVGPALEQVRRILAGDAAIYVGNLYRSLVRTSEHSPWLRIRIGRRRAPRAAFCVASQDDIDPLLSTLAALRVTGRGTAPLLPAAPSR